MRLTSLPPFWTMSLNILCFFGGVPLRERASIISIVYLRTQIKLVQLDNESTTVFDGDEALLHLPHGG